LGAGFRAQQSIACATIAKIGGDAGRPKRVVGNNLPIGAKTAAAGDASERKATLFAPGDDATWRNTGEPVRSLVFSGEPPSIGAGRAAPVAG
jgi:hypothetical protein